MDIGCLNYNMMNSTFGSLLNSYYMQLAKFRYFATNFCCGGYPGLFSPYLNPFYRPYSTLGVSVFNQTCPNLCDTNLCDEPGYSLYQDSQVGGLLSGVSMSDTFLTNPSPARNVSRQNSTYMPKVDVSKNRYSEIDDDVYFQPVQKKKKSKNSPSRFNTNPGFKSVEAAGYNPTLGARLAADALAHANKRSTHSCARYVSDSLERFGILTKRGDAYLLKDILRENPNFREVDINSVDLRKLPAGCIIVYPQGDCGYSKAYGHVEITLGDGRAVSDFVNKRIKKSKNATVFVPAARC